MGNVIGNIRLAVGLATMAVATLLLLPIQLFAMRTGWIRDGRVPRLWHRLAARVLGLRVRTHGRIAERRPLLIAANHVSWSDIVVLGSIAEVHFVAKSEMAGWPILGTFARLQRSVFVEREMRRKSGDQARELSARLANGDPMVLFAEGTTGPGSGVMPFKSTLFGAAQMALQNLPGDSVLVQPVAIAYTRLYGLPMSGRERAEIAWIGDTPLVPHLKSLFARRAMDVEVYFGEPVLFASGNDRKAVTREVESSVRTMLAKALRDPPVAGR